MSTSTGLAGLGGGRLLSLAPLTVLELDPAGPNADKARKVLEQLK